MNNVLFNLRIAHSSFRWSLFAILGLSLLLLFGGCGGEEEQVQEPIASVPSPEVHGFGPSQVFAGEEVTVTGAGFVDGTRGRVMVTLDGMYRGSSGGESPAHLEVEARYINQGVVVWVFGPNIPFGNGTEIGTFRGSLTVTNMGNDGTTRQSNVQDILLEVLPSIVLRQFRPAGASCSPDLTETVEDQRFVIEADAVGLTAGTPEAPIRFAYTFIKSNFQFRGYFADQLGIDPENLFPAQGAVTMIDAVPGGTVSTLGDGVPRDVFVVTGEVSPGIDVIPGNIDQYFGLTDLFTAPVGNDTANWIDAAINITAVDSSGRQARRIVRLRINKPVEVHYNGHQEIVRTFDPVPMSACIPGGDVGRDSTYSESTAETRNRQFQVDADARPVLGFDLFGISAQLNVEMGFNVSGSVSTTDQQSLQTSGFIVPGQFAVWYRQTIQLEKRAELVGHGPCGTKEDLGDAIVTDWIWSSDLAKTNGGACPPFPPSSLAAGQIYKPSANR